MIVRSTPTGMEATSVILVYFVNYYIQLTQVWLHQVKTGSDGAANKPYVPSAWKPYPYTIFCAF